MKNEFQNLSFSLANNIKINLSLKIRNIIGGGSFSSKMDMFNKKETNTSEQQNEVIATGVSMKDRLKMFGNKTTEDDNINKQNNKISPKETKISNESSEKNDINNSNNNNDVRTKDKDSEEKVNKNIKKSISKNIDNKIIKNKEKSELKNDNKLSNDKEKENNKEKNIKEENNKLKDKVNTKNKGKKINLQENDKKEEKQRKS